MKTIVKIQRPLESSVDLAAAPALIYNEDRSVTFEVPMSEIGHLFQGGEPKVYHKAVIKKGVFKALERVADQPW
ncbi:MAG: hypothetical protein KAG66_21590 [Methylococcales bacterium]|nr:hypothetical protein [Methylococcales bacterium]